MALRFERYEISKEEVVDECLFWHEEIEMKVDSGRISQDAFDRFCNYENDVLLYIEDIEPEEED